MREVPFFGPFYRQTTVPLLSEAVTEAESAFLSRALAGASPVLDLGCGHGRHLARLAPGSGLLAGVDLDRGALAEARRFAPAVAGDLLSLPFRSGSVRAAFAWYSTLFVFDEAGNRRALEEAARVLARGGTLLLQSVNPARLAESPEASFERDLPDGSRLEERARFDPATGRDEGVRVLRAPGAEPVRARFSIRYYGAAELCSLLEAAGLAPVRLWGGVNGEPFTPASFELIAMGVRR